MKRKKLWNEYFQKTPQKVMLYPNSPIHLESITHEEVIFFFINIITNVKVLKKQLAFIKHKREQIDISNQKEYSELMKNGEGIFFIKILNNIRK